MRSGVHRKEQKRKMGASSGERRKRERERGHHTYKGKE